MIDKIRKTTYSMKRSQVFINHITSEKYMEYRANLHISRIRVNLEFSA